MPPADKQAIQPGLCCFSVFNKTSDQINKVNGR
jgi:hypothetical protein